MNKSVEFDVEGYKRHLIELRNKYKEKRDECDNQHVKYTKYTTWDYLVFAMDNAIELIDEYTKFETSEDKIENTLSKLERLYL